eukprot:678544-Pyramimonas_sp.AAC.1
MELQKIKGLLLDNSSVKMDSTEEETATKRDPLSKFAHLTQQYDKQPTKQSTDDGGELPWGANDEATWVQYGWQRKDEFKWIS